MQASCGTANELENFHTGQIAAETRLASYVAKYLGRGSKKLTLTAEDACIYTYRGFPSKPEVNVTVLENCLFTGDLSRYAHALSGNILRTRWKN